MAYRHLLAPRQPDPKDLNAIEFDVLSLTGAGSVLQRAVRKIDESHVVLRKVGGTVLALALRQRSPRWADPHIKIGDLLEDLAHPGASVAVAAPAPAKRWILTVRSTASPGSSVRSSPMRRPDPTSASPST